MRFVPHVFAAPFVLALAGCVSSPDQLRADPGTTSETEVALPYQQVYRNIVVPARKCWQGGMGAQMVVTADLYTDSRTAEISQALHGGLGPETYMAIDLKALDDQHTRLKIAARSFTNAKMLTMVQQWARGEHTDCAAKT